MRRKVLFLIVILALTPALYGQTVVTLKNSFIEQYKNRATIDATFNVDHTSAIHPASQDGDIHIAGRAKEIGWHGVAEIMNAKTEKNQAVKTVKSVEGKETSPLQITGAWRIWSEHGGQIVETQGESSEPLDSSGAAHVFQIHPVSQADGRSLAHTFVPTAGYPFKDADTAFTTYERTGCQIVPHGDTTTIITSKVGYNYTEFVMVLNESPNTITDGTMVFADVETLQGESIVKHRRMVFVKDTEPETAVKGMSRAAPARDRHPADRSFAGVLAGGHGGRSDSEG